MEINKLRDLFLTTAANFNFTMPSDGTFKPLFNEVQKQTEKLPDSEIEKKFRDLWFLTNDEWHKKFNIKWGGYPSMAQWLEILVEKPLTDEQLYIAKKEHEEKLSLYAKFVIQWVIDPNLTTSFRRRYENPENQHLKSMIDKFCNVKEELPKERVKKMAEYLHKNYLSNKELFFNEMRAIADNQNQLLLN